MFYIRPRLATPSRDRIPSLLLYHAIHLRVHAERGDSDLVAGLFSIFGATCLPATLFKRFSASIFFKVKIIDTVVERRLDEIGLVTEDQLPYGRN